MQQNSRDSTTPPAIHRDRGLPFDLGFYHYTLPRTFYRFYHAVEQQNGKFLCFTVSCNKSALGFRLRRTSPRRSSLCASHFIESVGNECKLGTSGIQSSNTLWLEKKSFPPLGGAFLFFFSFQHPLPSFLSFGFVCFLFFFFFGKREGRVGGGALPLPSPFPTPEKKREKTAAGRKARHTGPAITNILAAMPVTNPSGCVKIDIQFFSELFQLPPKWGGAYCFSLPLQIQTRSKYAYLSQSLLKGTHEPALQNS